MFKFPCGLKKPKGCLLEENLRLTCPKASKEDKRSLIYLGRNLEKPFC